MRPYPVHYVFAPDGDPELVQALGAQTISNNDPRSQSSGKPLFEFSPGRSVPRLCYELQDTADIFATHWDRSAEEVENRDWSVPETRILFETELRDEAGRTVLPLGLHPFLTASRDDAGGGKHRRGYPAKHWFWGAYHLGRKGNFRNEAFARGAPRRTRALANGCEDCLGLHWMQHDYFAHSGEVAGRGRRQERGRWLPRGWHRPERNGFDGRWVQLFDDRPSGRCAPAASGP